MSHELDAGSSACVHSLTGRTELNGELVTLLSYDAPSARWVCRLSDGGRVSLRGANLQPIRSAGGGGGRGSAALDRGASTDWTARMASFPWAHFFGGLAVTLLAGHFVLGGETTANAARPKLRRASASHTARKAYDIAAAAFAGTSGPGLSSWVPLLLLIAGAGFVYANFVDAGAGGAGTDLQRRLRRGYAALGARVASLAATFSAFHMVVLAVGAMLVWSLYTDQLQLNLEAHRLIFLPIVLYALWSSRGQWHNMSPFQMLWIADMLMRMFRPGGGRAYPPRPRYGGHPHTGFGGMRYGGGGMRRGVFF